MALWIQTRPAEKCNLGELQVAELLAALSDDWVVRWGFYYRDNAETDREGDFLILSPDGGLLVLEVKNGRLECNPRTGKWNTADGDNPQYQLEAEWAGVLRQVKDFQGNQPSLFVGRALALPEVSLSPEAKEYQGIDRKWIFDRGDLRNFEATLERRMSEWGAHLDSRARSIFFDTYGKDATPSAIRHFVDETDRLLIRQTEVEYELLDILAANHQFLIQGGIGSGKTWLAFEQACRWATSGKGSRVLFLCYNLALTDLISSMVGRALARKRLPRGEIVVKSWEQLARELVEKAGLAFEVPESGADRTKFYEADLPQLLAQLVREKYCSAEFDALIVDEGQDHDTTIPGFPADWVGPGWWGVYWALLREGSQSRIAVFFDAAQRPAFRGGGGFDASALVTKTDFRPVQMRLTKTLRYTRLLFQYLAQLQSPALLELKAGMMQRGSLPEGPEVLITSAAPAEVAAKVDEVLASWFAQGWCRPEQVLVLSRHRQVQSSNLSNTKTLAGMPLVEYLSRKSGEVGMLSVNRAKGLDALAVVLVDYGPWGNMPESDHIGFFMGASRARQLLAIVQTVEAKA